jgi:hypothetical protein
MSLARAASTRAREVFVLVVATGNVNGHIASPIPILAGIGRADTIYVWHLFGG